MQIPVHTSRFINQFFTRVFVVSVPRFASRHKHVEENLQGLQFEFFWGADKQQLNIETVKADGTYDEELAKKLQRQGKALNLGEIACSLSHRNLYAEMLTKGWDKILILEDDVLPLTSNLDQLKEAMEELPADWELVYLGYLKHEQVTVGLRIKQFFYKIISRLGLMAWTPVMIKNLLPRPYSKHLKRAGFHDCTHAYAISNAGAKKLLANQTPVVYRADDLLSTTIMKGELKAFVTEPKFIDQENFHQTGPVSEIKE